MIVLWNVLELFFSVIPMSGTQCHELDAREETTRLIRLRYDNTEEEKSYVAPPSLNPVQLFNGFSEGSFNREESPLPPHETAKLQRAFYDRGGTLINKLTNPSFIVGCVIISPLNL